MKHAPVFSCVTGRSHQTSSAVVRSVAIGGCSDRLLLVHLPVSGLSVDISGMRTHVDARRPISVHYSMSFSFFHPLHIWCPTQVSLFNSSVMISSNGSLSNMSFTKLNSSLGTCFCTTCLILFLRATGCFNSFCQNRELLLCLRAIGTEIVSSNHKIFYYSLLQQFVYFCIARPRFIFAQTCINLIFGKL